MSTIIAVRLVKECARLVLQGNSIIDIREGLIAACRETNEALIESSQSVKTSRHMKNLMVTATRGDDWVVDIINKVIKKLGSNGVLTFSYGDSVENELTFQKGLSVDETLLSSYFEEPNKEFVELDDPLVLICADKINDIEEILNLTEKVVEVDKPLFVIAEEIGKDALSLLLLNKSNRTLNSVAIKAPAYGAARLDILEDIAAFTGTKVFGRSLGIDTAKIRVDELGEAGKVRVEKSRTIIMEGKGSKSRINKRIKELKERAIKEKGEFEKQTLGDRAARMMTGVGHIKVGGYTEHDKTLRRSQITRAYTCLKEGSDGGFIQGGGVALLKAATALNNKKPGKGRLPVYRAFARALSEPLCVLAANSGVNGEYIKEKIIDGGFKYGFNASLGKMEKLSSWSIADPLKTGVIAVESATSLAVNLLSSEIFIAEEPYEVAKDEHPMLGAGGYKGMRGITGIDIQHE
jgi:chaperonin GroEL